MPGQKILRRQERSGVYTGSRAGGKRDRAAIRRVDLPVPVTIDQAGARLLRFVRCFTAALIKSG
jgi:hypothetical protein